VVVVDRSRRRTAALVDDLGGAAVAVVGELEDDRTLLEAITEAEALRGSPGGVRLLVNAAGGGLGGEPTVEADGSPHDAESFRRTMSINAHGTFNACRLVAAAMASNEADADGARGVIVNTASIAGVEGQVGQLAYAAAKAAILGMTLPMARDLAPIGVRVCAIAPGPMGTAAMERLGRRERDAFVDGIAFPKRLGRPEEFALLVEAVAANPYLNGENIRLDGALRLPPGPESPATAGVRGEGEEAGAADRGGGAGR
jgi:NAD(P)-dependent dehydrogenase (short-subunit alcohol dehydrogenase family)